MQKKCVNIIADPLIPYNLLKKSTQKDNSFYITLNPTLEQVTLDTLISLTLEKFALNCKKFKTKLMEKKIQFPSAFKLDIKYDSVTKMKIDHPIIASLNQRIIFNPQFTNQKNLFEHLNYSGNVDFFDNEFLDEEFQAELLLTLLFWEILQKLKLRSDSDNYDIYIYPNRCNFFIVQNQISPFFSSNQTKSMNLLINTQTIQKIDNGLEINKEYELHLFDVHPPDEVINKGIIIQLRNMNENDTQINQYQNSKFEYRNLDQVTITPTSYYFIFSTLCQFEKKDELMHIITFDPSQPPKCQKCNINIHPDDFDTFYTKKGLYDVWEKGQLYLQQLAQFICPTFLLGNQNFKIMEDEKSQDLYVHFYQNHQKGKSQILNQEQNQDGFKQNPKIQDITEFVLLYKKLQVCSPFNPSSIKETDNQLLYSFNECLESDEEANQTEG
ncbi:unnamed protein product (macronuclear) [Paramecium tetraurelia]|uniref:Uncharacterized protein n=1 Tax=Paramecium tetraurelia TaxID=5888 RepID=A0ECH6_PARTE|nr:uncharacterized protein GSPATT00003862001 [Paramecium tetraurelia]CAK92993.1 unnamed protein product [Paramecium tetraurelia]|eukprot:XP_001460390.1 hypothetical protein (macronuclear) [Paramecium tetraurelia strain d4-2]